MGRLNNYNPISLKDVLRSSTGKRIRCLKFCDKVLGPLAVSICAKPKPVSIPISKEDCVRILVIRPGGVGDAVLLLPFINKLKEFFHDSHIDILAERRNIGIFNSMEGIVNECFCYEDGLFALRRRFQSASYNLVFDTEQWHFFSAAVSCASGAPIRVGFDTNKQRSRCYNVLVPYRHDEFEGNVFLRMLSGVIGSSIEFDWGRPFLKLAKADTDWATEKLSGRRAVAVSIKGGIKERCWALEKWVSLCRKLVEMGLDICLIGGGKDLSDAKRLLEAIPAEKLIDLTGKATLLQSASAIKECKLFIGTDSGPMHLAFSVGTPIVAMFGSGIQPKWAPIGKNVRILNRNLPCSPCTRFGYTPKCPIKVRCLEEISVEDILSAIQNLI